MNYVPHQFNLKEVVFAQLDMEVDRIIDLQNMMGVRGMAMAQKAWYLVLHEKIQSLSLVASLESESEQMAQAIFGVAAGSGGWLSTNNVKQVDKYCKELLRNKLYTRLYTCKEPAPYVYVIHKFALELLEFVATHDVKTPQTELGIIIYSLSASAIRYLQLTIAKAKAEAATATQH